MQSVRTDLAMEAHEMRRRGKGSRIDGVETYSHEENNIRVTKVEITNENGANALGKAVGTYITIEAPDLRYDIDHYEYAVDIIALELTKLAQIEDNTLTLVVGLGNHHITPDALGTETVSKLLVTHHIKQYMEDFFDEGVSGVCAIAPGVLGTTGIETVEIVKGIVERLKPQLIIAVDALAAADIKRVSTTIQIADTGIQPGAGVGNNRKGLNEETLGTKVIAIGVPTVIDAATISKVEIPKEYAPLMVTTKDIDAVIEKMSRTVANGINKALHKKLSLRDIESYVG